MCGRGYVYGDGLIKQRVAMWYLIMEQAMMRHPSYTGVDWAATYPNPNPNPNHSLSENRHLTDWCIEQSNTPDYLDCHPDCARS